MKLQDAVKENTVVHCKSYAEAKRITKEANRLGLKWCDGSSYFESFEWESHGDRTCYYFYNGEYSGRKFYEIRNFTIIPSTEIETSKQGVWQEKTIEVIAHEFRVALGMCGIYTSQNKAYTALLAAEKYLEKGGDFSLMDATFIESEVEKRNLNKQLKVF